MEIIPRILKQYEFPRIVMQRLLFMILMGTVFAVVLGMALMK